MRRTGLECSRMLGIRGCSSLYFTHFKKLAFHLEYRIAHLSSIYNTFQSYITFWLLARQIFQDCEFYHCMSSMEPWVLDPVLACNPPMTRDPVPFPTSLHFPAKLWCALIIIKQPHKTTVLTNDMGSGDHIPDIVRNTDAQIPL